MSRMTVRRSKPRREGESTFKFACERCRQHYEAYEDMRGDPLTCQSCGGPIRIPMASEGKDLPRCRMVADGAVDGARVAETERLARERRNRLRLAELASAASLSRAINPTHELVGVDVGEGDIGFRYSDGSRTSVRASHSPSGRSSYEIIRK